jgi:hypothetical protein
MAVNYRGKEFYNIGPWGQATSIGVPPDQKSKQSREANLSLYKHCEKLNILQYNTTFSLINKKVNTFASFLLPFCCMAILIKNVKYECLKFSFTQIKIIFYHSKYLLIFLHS